MRVLIDTNVLISAALNPDSVPSQAYQKAVSYPNRGLICEQNVSELKRIFHKKFPSPPDELAVESLIRDHQDRPILRAAIEAHADILLTGDKDFLESGVEHPKIMTPAEFVHFSD